MSILLTDFSLITPKTLESEEHLIITEISWVQYEQLLAQRANSLRYRVAYLDKTLEVMSPSRSHELIKKNIARLLEAYLDKEEIDYWGLGSITLRQPDQKAGKEPDECYCLQTEKDFPDLAIEVIVTSGGIDSLQIYCRLGIPEVWFWQNNSLTIYCLNSAQEYEPKVNSSLLPNLDIKLLSQYVNISNPRLALKEFRSKI